jgi:hypothetical protein
MSERVASTGAGMVAAMLRRPGDETVRRMGSAGVPCLIALLAATTSLVLPRPAEACTAPSCEPGLFLPQDIAFRPGPDREPERPGSLPSNAVMLLWRPPRGSAGRPFPPEVPRLFLVESGARRMLSYEITERDGLRLIQPQQPLAAGSELVFEYDDCELDPSGLGPRQLASARVSIAAAAPPPKSLGKLVAELEHGEAADFDQKTACEFGIDAAWTELSVDLTDEAVPYQDVLRFELHVDDQPVQPYDDWSYPGAPRPLGGGVLGRGRDRIVAACDRAERERGRHAVQLGRHRVQMVGVLPDGTRLTSDELTLDLECGQSAMDGCNTAAAGARRRPTLGTLAFVALAAWWVRRRNGR